MTDTKQYYGHDILKRVLGALEADDAPQQLPPFVRAAGRTKAIVTPTGQLTVIRPVAAKLLKEGVISGDLDGVLHAADAATVKAALVTSGVCDFCSAPGADHVFDVPDFEMPHGVGRSVDGWAACDVCALLVRADRRKELLERSVANMSFGKFTRSAIAELQARFWRGMDEKAGIAGDAAAWADYIEDRLPPDVRRRVPTLSERDQRVRAVEHTTGLTRAEIDRLLAGEIDTGAMGKLAAWRRRTGSQIEARELVDLMAGQPHKPLAAVMPHWQVALDMQYAAMAVLEKAAAVPGQSEAYASPQATDLSDPAAVRRAVQAAQLAQDRDEFAWVQDAKALRHAEAYSFNAETAQAITQAAASIPHDTPLSAIETPGAGRAGWFWFAAPLPVVTTSEAEKVAALLWRWESDADKRPVLWMSAYVPDPDGRGRPPIPSTLWNWRLTETFHEMIGHRTASYRAEAERMHSAAGLKGLIGEEATIKACADLSLFFVAACLWMRERIAVASPGHVERHARKRYAREHKLAEPPQVQVIALRRSLRAPAEGGTEASPDGGSGRTYHHQWVVSGHPRLQRCGPGRVDQKLIWIMPFTKGPEGAPLLTRKRVYAVVR